MSDIDSALVGAATAVIGGYFTTLSVENYRRFRDGSALAASLAGELGAHQAVLPQLVALIDFSIRLLESGKRPILRPVPEIKDPVFDEGIGRLGLLSPAVIREVVFVYQQIRAFRIAYRTLSEYPEMDVPELLTRFKNCRAPIELARERGEPLLAALDARAAKTYFWFQRHSLKQL